MSRNEYCQILQGIIGDDLSHWGNINSYVDFSLDMAGELNTYWATSFNDGALSVFITNMSDKITYNQTIESYNETLQGDHEEYDMNDPEAINKLRAKIKEYVERDHTSDD